MNVIVERIIHSNVEAAQHGLPGKGLFKLMFADRQTEKQRHQKAEWALEEVGLQDHRNRLAKSLPLPQLRRMEIARVLARDPALVFLDEPAGGMTPTETEDMARFILDIRQELGIAMILVEHDMALVMDIADRVLVLDFGEVIAIGTPDEVQRDPNVIKAYLGEDMDL